MNSLEDNKGFRALHSQFWRARTIKSEKQKWRQKADLQWTTIGPMSGGVIALTRLINSSSGVG